MKRHSFTEILRSARKERGATLRELAEAVGVTIAYVSDVEHGRRAPFKLENAAKAETFLGITDGRLVNAANYERQPKDFILRQEIEELRNRIKEARELIKKQREEFDSIHSAFGWRTTDALGEIDGILKGVADE